MTPLQDLSAELFRRSRTLRRRLLPRRYKETYINLALGQCPSPATYLEIGVRDGGSFRAANADRRVGIDPLRTEAMRQLRRGEEFFEMTSNAFFTDVAGGLLEPGSVDVALIDGLHEFRQVAQDFLNLEPYMSAEGIVFLDDFNPRSEARAADTPTGGAWNGDVWKLAPFLMRARPGRRYWTIDADEGIGVIAGFGGTTEEPPSDLVEECKALPYELLDSERTELLHLIPPRAAGPALAAATSR